MLDVENWKGYEDTSMTAKLQASYTDLLVLNKWELVGERALDDCLDRIGDLELDVPTPRQKSDKGWVDKTVLLGLDAKLAKGASSAEEEGHGHAHEHNHDHHSEVEVLSITLSSKNPSNGVDLVKLDSFLRSPPKDEVYRIKGVLYSLEAPASSTGEKADPPQKSGTPGRYILNWAFGRWTFTAVPLSDTAQQAEEEPVARLTVVTARYESTKWRRKIEAGEFVAAASEPGEASLVVNKVS